MSRNEIRLRRKRLTARGTQRFRNYDAVLKSHEENQRLKRVMKVFTIFTIILILIMLVIMLFRWEKRITYFPEKGNIEISIHHETDLGKIINLLN